MPGSCAWNRTYAFSYFRLDIGAWKHIETSRSCPVKDMLVSSRQAVYRCSVVLIWTALECHQVWTTTASASSQIHFPAARSPMAYMTENTNLQRALLRTIAEAGERKVEIREHSKVQEMKMDEGKRSVALKLGEHSWVRGGVVVSHTSFVHEPVAHTDFIV